MKPTDALARSFIESDPEAAARTFESLDPHDAGRLLARLPLDVLSIVFEEFAPASAAGMLVHLGPERVTGLLAIMPNRHASAVLQCLPESAREQALAGLAEPTRRKLVELLRYPDDTAGGMMAPEVTAIPMDFTAQAAINLLRKAPRGTVHYLYTVDREGRLTGVLTMRDLLFAAPKDLIEPLVNRTVLSVPASLDRAEVVALMRHRAYAALPVVDAEGRLIGVLKPDEVRQAGEIEAFEDLQKLVGAGGDEHALEPVRKVVRRRLPWLYVNLLTAFLASAVVGLFTDLLGKFPMLAVLLPIVSGQGGNSGAQSLAVVIRGLALREIPPGKGWRVVLKEAAAGLASGLAIALVTGVSVALWSGTLGYGLVIGLAMIVNMVAAGIAGAVIPMALRALGQDPAQSSSIFLTTVTDVVGFAAFLGCARWLSPILGPGA